MQPLDIVKKTFVIIFLCVCLTSIKLYSQIIPCTLDPVSQVDCDTVSINPIINFDLANNGDCFTTDNNVSIDIIVSDFVSVERLNLEIKFDPTIFNYSNIDDQILTGFSTINDFLPEGRLIISWINPTGSGLCVQDGSVIATINFSQLGTKRCEFFIEGGCDPAQDYAVIDFKDAEANCSVDIEVNPASFPVCVGCYTYDTMGNPIDTTYHPLEDIDILLSAPEDCLREGDTFCYEVSAENFYAISSLEMTLSFNSSVIEFTEIINGILLFGMENINDTQDASGRLRLVWLTPNPLEAACVEPDEVLFEICFDMLGSCGDDPELALVFNDNSPLPSVTTEITLQPCEPSASVIVEALTFCENELNLDIVNCGSDSQELIITPYCGVAPYTILINNTVEICAGLEEGETCTYNLFIQDNYEICITDAVGNEDCEQVDFFDIDPVTFDIITELPTCDNLSSDGKITIENIAGGTPGIDPEYTIAWSNGFYNTNTICDIPEGDYNLTITDALGCETVTTITLDTPPLNIIPTVIDTPSCTLDGFFGDGILEVCVENGMPPYILNNMSISPFNDCIQIQVQPGLEELVVRDSKGCRDTLYFDIPARDLYDFSFVEFSEACGECATIWIQVNFSGLAPECQNFSMIVVDENNQIVQGGGTFANSIYRNDCMDPGVYTLEVFAPPGNPCPGSDCVGEFTFEIQDLPPLQIDSIITEPGCIEDGGKIEITNVYGAEGEVNYEWSTNETGNIICNLTGPATYSVTITDDRCSNEFDFFIPAGGMADVTAICELIDCGSGNLMSNVVGGSGGGIEYTWLNLAGEILYEEQNVFGVPPGIYIVEASDISGSCVVRDTCELISDDGVVIDTSFIEDPECFDSADGAINISLTEGTPPYNMSWVGPGTFTSLDTLLNEGDFFLPDLACGLYMLTVTDEVGCVSFANFELNCPPDFTLSVINIEGVTCVSPASGMATIDAMGGPDATGIYEFFFSSGFSDIGPSVTGMDLESGQQWVFACDVTNTCCSDTLFFDVPEEEAIELDDVLTITTDVNCFGGSDGTATLVGGGGTAPYSYTWMIDNSNGDFKNDLEAGTYYIEVQDADGCTREDSIVINEPSLLEISLDDINTFDIGCASEDSGQITVDVTGGTPPYMYIWDNSDSVSDQASNLSAGMYCVTVVDNNVCEETFCYNLTEAPPITAVIPQPEMPDCFGGTTLICVESASGGVGSNYTFSVNFGIPIPIDSCLEVNAGPYTINVFDESNSNCSEETMFIIDQPNQLMVDLGEDITVELGDSLVELTLFTDSQFPIDTIIWDQDVACLSSLCDEVTIFPTNNGSISATVIDENGCIGFDEINITIDDVRNVFTANVFSPGNNNGNGEFRIVTGSGVERVNSFVIYDRWGNLMFETNEYEDGVGSAAWDGRFNGTVVQPGVYIYYANVSFIDGFVNEYKGSITVVR